MRRPSFLARLAEAWRSLFGSARRTELRPEMSRARSPAAARRAPRPSASATEIFTPTRPRTARRKLVGRAPELARILDALRHDGAHVVLYSERGRGKTSLANLVATKLRAGGIVVVRHACEADSDYDTIFRALAADLPHTLVASAAGEEQWLPAGPLRPQDIADFANRLACPQLVCIIDEFDRVRDEGTRTRLADTIKLLSDTARPVQFMIVGVAATLEHIIGQHPSIQRNIVPVHLPLLSDAEITAMLVDGGREIGLTFGQQVILFVLGLARGMPYMAQLLGLRLSQSALNRGAGEVDATDLALCIDRMIDDAQSGIGLRYAEITSGARDRDMVLTLRAVATAPQDRFGCLQATRDGATATIDRQRVSVASVDRLLDGGILQPTADPTLLRIGDRPLMYHVLLLALRDSVATAAERARADRATDLQSLGAAAD